MKSLINDNYIKNIHKKIIKDIAPKYVNKIKNIRSSSLNFNDKHLVLKYVKYDYIQSINTHHNLTSTSIIKKCKKDIESHIENLYKSIEIEKKMSLPYGAEFIDEILPGENIKDACKKLWYYAINNNNIHVECYNGTYAIAYPNDTSADIVWNRWSNKRNNNSPSEIELSEYNDILYNLRNVSIILQDLTNLYSIPLVYTDDPYEYILSKSKKTKITYNINYTALIEINTILDSILFLERNLQNTDKNIQVNSINQMQYFSEKHGTDVQVIMWKHVIQYCKDNLHG